MLHVVGLPSGKDIQQPGAFLPANARWSAPIAVDTTLYAATSGELRRRAAAACGRSISTAMPKPVVSWKTNGGAVVGAVAFTSDGTLIAAIGPGQATGDGKANAIVALDPKTLQVKDWFTQPSDGVRDRSDGPSPQRQGRSSRRRPRTAASCCSTRRRSGGANHSTPLSASKPLVAPGATISGDALRHGSQRLRLRLARRPPPWHIVDSVPVTGKLAGDACHQRSGYGGRGRGHEVADAGGTISSNPHGYPTILLHQRRRSSSTASCSRPRPACQPHRADRARQPSCMRTTERQGKGSGRAVGA